VERPLSPPLYRCGCAWLAKGTDVHADDNEGRHNAFHALAFNSHAESGAKPESVGCPSLVIMGAADPNSPNPEAEANELGHVLGSDVVLVAGVGHYPPSPESGRGCRSDHRLRRQPRRLSATLRVSRSTPAHHRHGEIMSVVWWDPNGWSVLNPLGISRTRVSWLRRHPSPNAVQPRRCSTTPSPRLAPSSASWRDRFP